MLLLIPLFPLAGFLVNAQLGSRLSKAVKGLKEGDAVELAGHLVDVAATKKTQNYWWNSSMTTEDRGDGACEIIYLTHLKVHGKIYQ